MQPDPISPSQEEKKPEAAIPGQGQVQPEPCPEPEVRLLQPLPAPTSAQPAPAPVPVQPIARPAPVPAPVQAKPPTRWGNIAAVVLGLGVVFLVIVAAALGFWGYNLNTQLTATQQELATVQGDYGKLKAEYANLQSENEKVNADLTQSKADLEKANADLVAAQDSLKTSQDQYTALNAKVEKAAKYVAVLSSMMNGDSRPTVDGKVDATDDSRLSTVWNNFKSAQTTDAMGELLLYLIRAIDTSLK